MYIKSLGNRFVNLKTLTHYKVVNLVIWILQIPKWCERIEFPLPPLLPNETPSLQG